MGFPRCRGGAILAQTPACLQNYGGGRAQALRRFSLHPWGIEDKKSVASG